MLKYVLATVLLFSLGVIAMSAPEKSVEKVSVNPLYCTMCQYAVQFLDVELKKNSTEQAIVKALDTVCKIAPASSRSECDSLINTYGIYLVQLLIQFGDPLKVCQTIHLC